MCRHQNTASMCILKLSANIDFYVSVAAILDLCTLYFFDVFYLNFFEFLISKNLGVDQKMKVMSNHGFARCAWWPFRIFAFCDLGSKFLEVYPGYFQSHITLVHECKAKLSASFIEYGVL